MVLIVAYLLKSAKISVSNFSSFDFVVMLFRVSKACLAIWNRIKREWIDQNKKGYGSTKTSLTVHAVCIVFLA